MAMPYASSRPAATILALALLAACGGTSNPPPVPPGPLELACSVSRSGPEPILTVVGRATTKAAAGAPAITVTLQLNPTPRTFTLSGPGWVGSAELRGASLSPGATVTGQATVDGTPVTASCVGYGGLPAVTAHVDRTPTGAGVTWQPVSGAAVYRWSLRDGLNGAVVGSGTTTSTSGQVTAALDPLKVYVAEVGAYALTGSETSFPSPLPVPKAAYARVTLTAGSTGGDGVTAWQLFGPGDYVGSTLTIDFPALAVGERLAVLVVNAGGIDRSAVTVTTAGTGDPNFSVAPLAPLAAMAAGTGTGGSASGAGAGEAIDRSGVMAGEALVSAWREETIARLRDGRLQRAPPASPTGAPLAATAAAQLPATRSFCQGRYSGTGFTQLWRSATLAYQTPEGHAAFYYTDEVKPGIDKALLSRPDFFTSLGAAYESKILLALNTYFGPESDVDRNGLVIFLFGNLGKTSSNAFPVGYFWPGDIELPLATSSSCPRNTAGNRADMLYLIDPGNFTANWDPTGSNYAAVLDLIVDGEYPNTMAHELQHDVNYNTRCPSGAACGVDEEVWLNEGLSMLSETVAGYGLHAATSRANVRSYQGELDPVSGLPYYRAFSMTGWEGHPYGNYAGVQAYMQYLLDHATPTVTRALENQWLAGKANVESATGLPWEVGFARFTTAAMFSNEDTSEPNGGAGTITSTGHLLADPAFNYLGVNYPGVPPAGDYVPWHHYMGYCTSGGVQTPKARDAHVRYTPLATSASASATLRRDGWAAFATGPGSGGAASVAVQSSAAVRPHVVVVKYTGKLPSYVAPTCP